MDQKKNLARHTRTLSLSVRISGLLVLASILPLVLTVVIINILSRPTLIAQNGQDMQIDAQAHAQLIDNYFAQQIFEARAISRSQALQKFLGGDKSETMKAQAQESLATGREQGSYYEDWSLLDLQGNLQLYYPSPPALHGQYYIAPTYLQNFRPDDTQQIQLRSAQLSDIFYNPVTNEAYIDIYAPVFSANYQLVGILRTTFDLHYIWDIVNKEAGANGVGSYAMILDRHGVCIAQTSPNPDPFSRVDSPNLFKTSMPLSEATRQLVVESGLYNGPKLPMLDNGKLLAENIQKNRTSFQIVPPGLQANYQASMSTALSVHWNYILLNPLNNITTIADNLILLTSLITCAVLVLAVLIGMGVGRHITKPLLHSANYLHKSSEALKELARKEQSAATQQTWVVDSSQVGLHTVQYYTNAATVALQRLKDIGNYLVSNWEQLHPETAKKTVEHLVETVHYLEKAILYQTTNNKKLESTIKVTIQVADQLATGATSATKAAEQLEQVVNQLQHIIGK